MNIIQIGCNDCSDEANKFIQENKEKINKFLVIDALPRCTEIAKTTYAFLGEKVSVLNCAVGIENTITNFYFPSYDDKCGHSSLSINHLHQHQHKTINNITVPVIDVNLIFKFFNEKVDWFFIDTEGFDVPILLHLDFDIYRPNNIHYEFAHSDGPFNVGVKHHQLIEKFKKYHFNLTKTSAQNMTACLS